MGRLIAGVTIILFLLLVGFLSAFIVNGTAQGNQFVRCSGTDTNTTCENVGKTTFFSAVRDVSLGDFGSDTPPWITGLWFIIGGLLLATAVLLVVLAFVPLTSE